ncbi:MAG: DoxX family protein [Weeksellaceae bacterium]
MTKHKGWGLFLFRLFLGFRIVYGMWNTIFDSDKLAQFAAYLSIFKIPSPNVMAPISVSAQIICGIMLILGLETRFVALLMIINFAVALFTVDIHSSIEIMTPTLSMLFGSILLFFEGPGKFSLDGILKKRKANKV